MESTLRVLLISVSLGPVHINALEGLGVKVFSSRNASTQNFHPRLGNIELAEINVNRP